MLANALAAVGSIGGVISGNLRRSGSSMVAFSGFLLVRKDFTLNAESLKQWNYAGAQLKVGP
jgi:hypothetical protein